MIRVVCCSLFDVGWLLICIVVVRCLCFVVACCVLWVFVDVCLVSLLMDVCCSLSFVVG